MTSGGGGQLGDDEFLKVYERMFMPAVCGSGVAAASSFGPECPRDAPVRPSLQRALLNRPDFPRRQE